MKWAIEESGILRVGFGLASMRLTPEPEAAAIATIPQLAQQGSLKVQCRHPTKLMEGTY
jgi:hypothetical protein